jgi:YVTN family beta-propeller protein
MAITPDSRIGYVANNNNYGIAGEDSVSILDLKHNLLIGTLQDPSFNEPYTITMGINGTKAYVTNSGGTTITVINTATNSVSAVIGGFDGPSGMVITPAGNRAYVNNYGSAEGVGSGNGTTVRVVDLNSNTIIGAPIQVGLAPAALAISPDGNYVYVVNYEDGNPGTGTMDVIRTSDNIVIATIGGFPGPFAIAITPNGRRAYVTNFGRNNFEPFGTTVSVVDLMINQIVDTIHLGIQPSGVVVTNNCLAYVTNYNTLYAGSDFTDLTPGEGTVNIIDTRNNMVIAPTIVVGQAPGNITIAPNGKHAYVSNYISNTVSVIKLKH